MRDAAGGPEKVHGRKTEEGLECRALGTGLTNGGADKKE